MRVIEELPLPGNAEIVGERPARRYLVLCDARAVTAIGQFDAVPVDAQWDGRVVGEMHDDLVTDLQPNLRTRHDSVEREGRGHDTVAQVDRGFHRDEERLEDVGIRVHVDGLRKITLALVAGHGSRSVHRQRGA